MVALKVWVCVREDMRWRGDTPAMLAACMRGEGAGETNLDTGGFVQFVRLSYL
jgi:hypothetical protein